MSKQKVSYTVSKPGMSLLNCGVFTNKKILFDTLNKQFPKDEYNISFIGALDYERKCFNYFNLGVLLNMILPNESFSLKITSVSDPSNVTILELTVTPYNTLFNL